MTNFKTEQEQFWAGNFGDEYTNRNIGANIIASNTALFSKILSRTEKVNSVIEFGANIGLNLQAIRNLLPQVQLQAIEINDTAVKLLEKIDNIKIYNQSILDFIPLEKVDFVLIKGVLIHINPDFLVQVYDLLYNSCGRYLCLSEYYNPTPVEINYRGHSEKLFKRDFAGEILDRFPNFRLIDYGFVYHRDPWSCQEDINWFLLEKI
ncbi:pseudaminic acid biosynthesis-associated methylase [Geminocystis sp. CENA526]|uniref:pseudaminic acid biosynthesis-associated methylase n=1 Tax=Geminocystis sp. CENA526 TaxID=1355871 RepID=UPI003D6F17B9